MDAIDEKFSDTKAGVNNLIEVFIELGTIGRLVDADNILSIVQMNPGIVDGDPDWVITQLDGQIIFIKSLITINQTILKTIATEFSFHKLIKNINKNTRMVVIVAMREREITSFKDACEQVGVTVVPVGPMDTHRKIVRERFEEFKHFTTQKTEPQADSLEAPGGSMLN
jgi:hypothetical protein